MIPTIIEIRERLEKAWSIETTFCPESYRWNDKAWGQCAVSSLLIHSLLGGIIMRGVAKFKSIETLHYWNRIDGLDIDLTWRQFPAGTTLSLIEEVKEEEMLWNKWFEERYLNLYYKY